VRHVCPEAAVQRELIARATRRDGACNDDRRATWRDHACNWWAPCTVTRSRVQRDVIARAVQTANSRARAQTGALRLHAAIRSWCSMHRPCWRCS